MKANLSLEQPATDQLNLVELPEERFDNWKADKHHNYH